MYHVVSCHGERDDSTGTELLLPYVHYVVTSLFCLQLTFCVQFFLYIDLDSP